MGLRVQPQKPPLQALLAKCGFMLGAFDNGFNTKNLLFKFFFICERVVLFLFYI